MTSVLRRKIEEKILERGYEFDEDAGVSERLAAIAALVRENPEVWTRGEYLLDNRGRVQSVESEATSRACAVGLVKVAFDVDQEEREALDSLKTALPEDWGPDANDNDVERYNDDVRRTHLEVSEWFRMASEI